MALYSVWSWPKNSWAIYETPAHVSVGDDPIAPRPRGVSPIGADPDTHVKPLPAGARYVGQSHVARGEIRRIASWGQSGDDGGSSDSTATSGGMGPLVAFGIGVIVTIAWVEWQKRRRGR